MLHPRRGDFIRGTSVLAALVFVAVLSAIAYGVHSIVPSDPIAQAAASGATSAASTDTLSKPLLAGPKRCIELLEKEEQGQGSDLDDIEASTSCVNGCLYRVTIEGGKTTVTASDLAARTDGTISAEYVSRNKCIVQQCDASGKCIDVASMTGVTPASYLQGKVATAASINIKNSTDLQQALADAKSGSMDAYNKLSPELQAAFKAEQASAVAANEQRIKKIESIVEGMGDGLEDERTALQSEAERLKKENQNLARVTTAVSGGQSSISPGCGSGLTLDGACPSASPDRVPDQSNVPRQDNTFASASVCGEPGANPNSCIPRGTKETGTFDDTSYKDDRKVPSSTWNPYPQEASLTRSETDEDYTRRMLRSSAGGQGHSGPEPVSGSEEAAPAAQYEKALAEKIEKEKAACAMHWGCEIVNGQKCNAGLVRVVEFGRNCSLITLSDAELKETRPLPCNPNLENCNILIDQKKSEQSADPYPESGTRGPNEQRSDPNPYPESGTTQPNESAQTSGRSGGAGATEPDVAPQVQKPFCSGGKCTVNASPGEGMYWRDQGYECRWSQETGSAFGVCTKTDPTSATTRNDGSRTPSPTAPTSGGGGAVTGGGGGGQLNPAPGTVLQQDSYCLVSKVPLQVVPVRAGQRMPDNCINNSGNSFAQDERQNQINTQEIFKGLIQGLTLGMLFNQSQQSQNPYGAGGYGGYGAYPPPYQQPNNNPAPAPTLQCPQAPPQPSASACQGAWQQETLPGPNGQQCVSGWKCNTTASASTTAQISCAPLVADEGMQVSISYTCANASKSAGSNFSTNGALSGTASATLSGTATSSVYSVACTNDKNETATASCTVQVAKPAIVLITNPASVEAGKKSVIGWVTSGMQSCIVSSPDSSAFTTQNADKTATTGSAQTPPIAGSMRINLTCQTVGGGTRAASATVTLK